MKQSGKHVLHGALYALLAALASNHALAQTENIQVYGIVDAYLGTSKTATDARSTAVLNSGGMTTSFWGIGGSESLGGSLKAVFALEGYFLADSGAYGRSATDAMFSRNAYVGVAGALGEIRLGRLVNPLFYATAFSNPFGGSTRFSPLMDQSWIAPFGRNVAGDTGWNNAISYTLPAFGNFSAVAQFGLGEAAGGNGANNSGVTVSYRGGPLYAAVNAQKIKAGPGITAAVPAQTSYFAGASYALDAAKLFASYGWARSDGSGLRARTAQLGASIRAGGGDVLLSWAHTSASAPSLGDSKRDTAALGYDYPLSKRTDVYAVYLRDRLDSASTGNSFGLGIRHKF
jgi:predicted porin